jgi:hypothetical protein
MPPSIDVCGNGICGVQALQPEDSGLSLRIGLPQMVHRDDGERLGRVSFAQGKLEFLLIARNERQFCGTPSEMLERVPPQPEPFDAAGDAKPAIAVKLQSAEVVAQQTKPSFHEICRERGFASP